MAGSDALSIAAFVLSAISFIVSIGWSIGSFFLNKRHQRLMTSFDLLQNFTTRRDHPWNIASWLFNSDQYPGLPFKLGQVEFRLGEEIYLFASDKNQGNDLFQDATSAIKAALMDCCVEIETLLDLTKRNEVDRLCLRKMVNTLVYRLAKSDRDEIRVYGELLQQLAVLYKLPFRVTIAPPVPPSVDGALILGSWHGQVPVGRELPLDFPPW